jgi:hypothetical protein
LLLQQLCLFLLHFVLQKGELIERLDRVRVKVPFAIAAGGRVTNMEN